MTATPVSRLMMDCTSPPPVDRTATDEPRPRRGARSWPRGGQPQVGSCRREHKPATGRSAPVRDLFELDVQPRHVAPQLLEAVEVAHLGDEDVHDDVEVVHEDPA